MYLDLLWKFLKPISFSLIGKEVNFSVLDGNMVLYGAITLFIGVAVSECVSCIDFACKVYNFPFQIRLITSYLASAGAKLKWQERAYVTISGLPKATVQVIKFYLPNLK